MKDKLIKDWEKLYQEEEVETMPWYRQGLDQDFARALDDLGISKGKALDIGAGPGTQAAALAQLGFYVVGTDISKTATDKASKKYGNCGLNVGFRQDDILNTKQVEKFDVIFDRGCFHILSPEQRPSYVRNVKKLLAAEGYLFLKVFSHLQPGDEGPYRFSETDLENALETGFKIKSFDATIFEGNHTPPPKALFAILQPL